MIAKKTSKNQLTLPKKIVEQFPDVQYFNVRVDEGQITLVPVRPGQLEQVQARLQQMGLSERDVRNAVAWARSSRRSSGNASHEQAHSRTSTARPMPVRPYPLPL